MTEEIARRAVASGTVLSVVLAALGQACSAAPLEGEGGACTQVTDCAEGLVCVPQSSGARVCSANLAPVEGVPGTTGDAGADGRALAVDGAADDATTREDATTPGLDAQADVTPAEDSGAPPADAASDARTPDASSPDGSPRDAALDASVDDATTDRAAPADASGD